MHATRTRRSLPIRLVRVVLVVVLLLVMLFYAGGGWYFSGRIRADALEVKPYPAERNLTLTPVGAGQLRVSSSEESERRMLAAPSTFGIRWRGGYGQVFGDVVTEAGPGVVRRFRVVLGVAPPPRARGEIDLVAFPDDPRIALGPTVRTVSYTSPAGDFPAWLVPRSGQGAPGDDTWAVVVHGKGGSRMEMFRMARAFRAQGLTTLDLTYRNDTGLPQDPSGFYAYGSTEWRDLRAAVRYAASQGARRVVLGADSMGGAVVASYLRHRGEGEPDVAALVLDAPMLDFADTIRHGARQISLPVLGPVPDSLTWTARGLAALRFDVDWDSVDYLDDTRWLTVPTLVFHGTADSTVPLSTSRELARDQPKLVRLVETKGVEHVRSWNADPAAYDRHIAELLIGLGR